MNEKQGKIRLIIILSLIILSVSSNLLFVWIKMAGSALFWSGIIQIICFFSFLISFIILIVRIIKFKKWRNTINFFTIGFTIIIFVVLNIEQFNVNENTFQSDVIFRACREGTIDTSELFFREDGTFEDFNIGWFAYVYYTNGTWKQIGDTLFLDFEGEMSGLLGNKILIKDDYLYKIHTDTLIPTHYYLGYCKRLN